MEAAESAYRGFFCLILWKGLRRLLCASFTFTSLHLHFMTFAVFIHFMASSLMMIASSRGFHDFHAFRDFISFFRNAD